MLLAKDPKSSPPLIKNAEMRQDSTDLPALDVIEVRTLGSVPVIFFNSLTTERKHIASLLVDYPMVKVTDVDGTEMRCQLNPVWTGDNVISDDTYELFFEADLPPLGFNTYFVEKSDILPPIPEITVVAGEGRTLDEPTRWMEKEVTCIHNTLFVNGSTKLSMVKKQ